MRRTLAGLLFGLAYACIGLTVAGFLLERTAFDPSRSGDAAGVVLGDSRIKTELVDVIADSTADQLSSQTGQSISKASMRQLVGQVASHPDGAKLFAKVIHDAHARLIGERTQPVQITGADLVPIVRNQAAANLSPITIPVPRITALSVMRTTLHWLVPLAALATLVFVVLGFLAHPERTALFKSLGLGLLLLAVLVVVLGYLTPRFIIPTLSSNPWARVPARLADDSLPLLIGTELVLVGAGFALLAGTGILRRRQRWSTPISTYRYQEERRWS